MPWGPSAVRSLLRPAALAFAALLPCSALAEADPPTLATPADQLVADIGHRLAVAGRARCPLTQPAPGLTLRHLDQYEPRDRPLLIGMGLERGPVVLAVAAGGPAADAGVRPGDVLLAIDGVPPPPPQLGATVDAARARAHADAVLARLGGTGAGVVRLDLLRAGAPVAVSLRPAHACRSIVHLARSNQRNAYADGAHVFLTTRVVAEARGRDEVAFLLAHEMAHNALGHAAAMQRAGVRRGLARTFGRGGTALRDAERAADRLGAELMLDAGYDPVAGAAVLRRLGGLDLGLAFLASHDGAARRIEAVRRVAAARTAPVPAEAARR